uniref:Putative secreted peptide n=1 Tax=Anopheles braziliensis TaxID=58242 RepID=A0A2M3ZMT8_9DIPT
MATSLLVGTCLASFTLAKLPLPIVFSSLYLPMCSSPDLHRAVVPRICIFGEPLSLFTSWARALALFTLSWMGLLLATTGSPPSIIVTITRRFG